MGPNGGFFPTNQGDRMAFVAMLLEVRPYCLKPKAFVYKIKEKQVGVVKFSQWLLALNVPTPTCDFDYLLRCEER
jgi:hypothetical protein